MSGRHEHRRVLVVEDDATNRSVIAEALARAGFETQTAATGERALLALREWPRRIGWLYTRTELPGLVDGWMLADEFHQTRPGRPVLLAGVPDDDRRHAETIVLDRSVPPARVVEILQGLLAGARASDPTITALAA